MKKKAWYYIDTLFNNKYLFTALYVFLILLYALVSVQSYGYDDEFFNISVIEKLGFKAIGYLQHTDIHPPLSYIINAVLFKAFHSWVFVRLFSGLLTACALILVVNSQRKYSGNQQALVVFLLLALNPAILMWCTGIRWYAYFLPVLLYLVFRPMRTGYKEWVKALAAIVILGYTEYSTFLILLPVLILYWACSEDTIKNKLKYLLYLAPVFLALYAYQLFVFFTVHLKNQGMQVTHSLIANLRGYFISQVSNQGVFPISVPTFLSVAGCAGILFCIIKYLLRGATQKKSTAILAAYIVAVILVIVSGVAWKPRNLILLIPFHVFLIAHYYTLLRQSKTYIGSVLLIATANVCGCSNVFFHENTTKNSWNLPVKETIAEITRAKENDSTLVIFTHDPTLAYVLQQDKFNVVTLNKREKKPEYGNSKTAIFINTFRGSIPKGFYDSLIAEENNIRSATSKRVKIGRDKYYPWKRKIDEEYPEYQVELIIYSDPERLNKLVSWNGKSAFRTLLGND